MKPPNWLYGAAFAAGAVVFVVAYMLGAGR